MFDRIYSPRVTEQVTKHVDVHEHRAPTDESIKLYHELREKAEKETVEILIKATGAENVLNHVQFRSEQDVSRGLQRTYIAFDLNGTTHKIECTIERFDVVSRESLVEELGREILRQIGKHFDVERDLGISKIRARLKT